MSTETRNFAIVRRLAQSTPTTPGNLRGFEELQPGDTRYILQAAAWNKNIDAYMCERGIVAVRAYIALALQRAGDAAMNRNHPAVINLSRIFLRELNILSPLLVDDGTFPTAQYVSEHPRGSWRGSHEDFDIRSQAIKLNSTWVEVAVRCMEYYRRNNRSKYNSSLFQLSLFRLCLGYLHETGHLLQTFVGHGEQDTPPQAGSGRHSSGGEAGEFMEKAFMGGLVDFHNDGTTLGTQIGFPWIIPDSGDARRVDLYSIGLFLQPRWQGGGDMIISPSSTSSAVRRSEGRRPRISDGEVMSTERSARAATVTMRTGLEPRRDGVDIEIVRLRQVTSPPVESEPIAD